MADYSVADLTAGAGRAGFSGASLGIAVAVSLAENTARSLHALNVNGDGSRDRGPWQINDRAHPDVADSCAFDLDCSAQAAYQISDRGRDWSPWTTYVSGAYRSHLLSTDQAAPMPPPSSGDQGIGAFGSRVAGAIGSAGQGLTDTALGALLTLLGALVLGVAVWMLARQSGPGQAARGALGTAARVAVAATVHV